MEENQINTDQIIFQTKKWITEVIIACNFCPFAAKVVRNDSVHYQVDYDITAAICLEHLITECVRMDEDDSIETSLQIFPNGFKNFEDYLDMLSIAEKLLSVQGYDGIYQLASFHPDYCFAGALVDDAANFTNRSVYPMLHLLRESRIDEALLKYPNPEKIPDTNINFARKKGMAYMQLLRDNCL